MLNHVNLKAASVYCKNINLGEYLTAVPNKGFWKCNYFRIILEYNKPYSSSTSQQLRLNQDKTVTINLTLKILSKSRPIHGVDRPGLEFRDQDQESC